ncbi:MAG: AAA family ATPase [Bacilli bacterium]|nr:AAA family ATPase [Bacilli bacterium]
MEEEKELQYALIVRKFELANSIFIYRPERVVMGRIKDGRLYREHGNKSYDCIKDEYFNYSNEDEGYYKLDADEETIKEYLETGGDDISFFEDKFDDILLVGYINPLTEKFVVDEFSMEDLFDDSLSQYFYVDHSGDKPKVKCTVAIDDILKIIEETDYDKEKIKEIMGLLRSGENKVDKYLRDNKDKVNLDNLDSINLDIEGNIESKPEEEQEDEDEEEIIVEMDDELTPKEKSRKLYQELKNRIIGQESAINTVCYVLYKNSRLEDGQKKTNCLLVGPTGCGKSEIINIISEVYDKPLVHVDSNSNTAAGYVGDSLTDNLATLMVKAGGDKYKAEHGIIAFDEIDKRGTSDRNNINGKAVLDSILRFAEGQEYNIEYKIDDTKYSTIFDTSNLTIFASGAFPEVFKEKLKKIGHKSGIGFNAAVYSKEEAKEDLKDLEKDIELTHEDIATTGNMGPEFTGRFIIATLHKLGIDDLKDIMTKSTISPLREEMNVLFKDNINIEYDDKFITNIAEKAYHEGSGGRGIRNNLEDLFKKIYQKVIFENNDDLEDENGVIMLKATTDKENNIAIKTTTGKNLLERDKKKIKVKVKA